MSADQGRLFSVAEEGREEPARIESHEVPQEGFAIDEPPGAVDAQPPDPDQLHLVDGEAPYWTELLDGQEEQGDRALSLLVDLVRQGNVDPWDVDLEVVAERFMEAVDALGPEDLPKSGRLLFFASVLIRMKAQYLAGRTQDLMAPLPQDEGWEDGEIEWGPDGDPEAAEALSLQRRRPGEILFFPRQRIRKRRPITIQDLLEALESSEAHERKMASERQRRGERKASLPFKSVKEAMEVLHQDDLTGDIAAASRLVRLAFESMEAMPLGELTARHEGGHAPMDEVSAFLAVLFLAARGEVHLEQDSFYGPVRVRRPPEGSAPVRIVPRERFVPVRRKGKAERALEEAALAAEAAAAAGLDPSAAAPGDPGAHPEVVVEAPPAPGPELPADPVAAAALRALIGLRRAPDPAPVAEPDAGAARSERELQDFVAHTPEEDVDA